MYLLTVCVHVRYLRVRALTYVNYIPLLDLFILPNIILKYSTFSTVQCNINARRSEHARTAAPDGFK